MRGVAGEPSDAPSEAYLLTETADGIFPHFGFTLVGRSGMPEGVRGSVGFFSACPQSAEYGGG